MRWIVGAMVVSGIMALAGCELIASVPPPDDPNAGGGTAAGGGGTTATGGSSTGNGGTTATGCMSDADCTPATDECEVAKCDTSTGVCSDVNVDDGTPSATQTDQDCKKNVCMGGAVTAVADATDVLDDGNPCTDDACDANNEPISAPTAAGIACAVSGGNVCDGAGACVECLMDIDCPDPLKPICLQNVCIVGELCMDGKKNGDETAPDCGGSCGPCADLLACIKDGDCKSDVCTGMVCQAPTCGDGKKNGTETDVDCGAACGAGNLCGANKGCDADADCKGNQCTGMAGVCVPNCNDAEKNNAETDVDCGGPACLKCQVGKGCGNSDSNCVSTAYCDAGTCAAKKNNGTGCVGPNECSSGACADSVCCNSACGATCFACTGAKTGQPTGTCAAITINTDPDNECAGTSVCDGFGNCGKPQGAACAAGSECVSGNCADGFCCNTACSGTCKACSAAKTGGANGTCGNVTTGQDPDNECPGSLTCTAAATCSATLADGASCTVDGECSNGHCVDGVCCNVACGGSCQACSAAKKGSGANGTCGPIASGSDPDSECAGTDVCNGSGACGSPLGATCAAGGTCLSGHCVDNVCCNTVCNGTCQACVLAKSGSPDGTCGAITVLTDPDNECTLTCNGLSGCIKASGQSCAPGAPAACDGGAGNMPITCPAGGTCP